MKDWSIDGEGCIINGNYDTLMVCNCCGQTVWDSFPHTDVCPHCKETGYWAWYDATQHTEEENQAAVDAADKEEADECGAI